MIEFDLYLSEEHFSSIYFDYITCRTTLFFDILKNLEKIFTMHRTKKEIPRDCFIKKKSLVEIESSLESEKIGIYSTIH